jgi:hypothetical protein
MILKIIIKEATYLKFTIIKVVVAVIRCVAWEINGSRSKPSFLCSNPCYAEIEATNHDS